VIGTQDIVLLGRRMYDAWSNYWPKSDDQPFADFINNVHKYVATASPLTNEWTRAEPIQGPVDHFVRKLKAGQGGDIGIHGSISLAQYLLAQGSSTSSGSSSLRGWSEAVGVSSRTTSPTPWTWYRTLAPLPAPC
jgi:dihydrofolate reductase